MITDFGLLIGDARLSTNLDSDQIHLIKMFMMCLNLQFKKKIIFGDIVLKTIEEWYAKAIQYNLNYRLTQAMMALDNQSPRKKPWINQNQNKDPNMMDIGATTMTSGTAFIGALTEEMRTVLMKIPVQENQSSFSRLSFENQGQQQQQQVQKTYTPKDVHTNIRSMTAEQRKELMEMLTTDSCF